MNLLGIIAEYNPFHNGHKYHIEKSISDLKPDATIVVMSGNFTQRGNIACFDKWTRAKAAILNGVDLVIELPVTFSTASAERFAYGGVYLLDKMGVNTISFGSEDDLSDLQNVCDKLISEDFTVNKNPNVPFHISRQHSSGNHECITKPNNILAIEYLKAIKTLNSDIIPHRIKRLGAGYHDTHIAGNKASATKVREMLQNSENIENVIPYNLSDIYQQSKIFTENDFYPQLRYSIVSKSPAELEEFAHIREGIENRIYRCALQANSFDDLIKKVKSKRYTYTSVSRMLISIFLGIKRENLCEFPQYIRVLGLNDRGAKALKYIEAKCNLPIITKVSNAHKMLSESAFKELELDLKAGDIFGAVGGIQSQGRLDFIHSPIKI